MNRATCRVNVANLMALPDHKSELLTQLFLHDEVKIVERKGNWMSVFIEAELMQGWILAAQLSAIAPFEEVVGIVGLQGTYRRIDNEWQFLHPGTFVWASDFTSLSTERQEGRILNIKPHLSSSEIHSLLHSFLYAPYMWGGMTRSGIDCSGFSRLLFRYMGVHLPQLAREQAKQGEFVDFLIHAQMGDLAFFVNEEQEVNHVGILLSADEIIHASEVNGEVCCDGIDSQGIVNKRNGEHTHTLRMIKRLIPTI